MPRHDTVNLLASTRSGSTAAPLELFIQIRETLQTLVGDAPLVSAEASTRTRLHAAYQRMVPHEARTPERQATFLSVGAAATRHLLKQEAESRLEHAPVPGSTPSFQVLSQMLRDGAPFDSRHWRTLLALDDALTQLNWHQPQAAEILEGRLFGQMRDDELARALTLSTSAVQNGLSAGMTWLRRYEAADRSSAAHRPQLQP